MFGSYGSYSSMSSNAQPLDIAPTSYLARSNSFQPSCAFPSWPQERASSYLSDDDLFSCESVTEDPSSTTEFSPSTSPQQVTSPFVTEEQMHLLRRQQQAAMQQEALQFIVAEKERRKQARKVAKRTTSYTKSSRASSKTKHSDE
ncbi:hypothetical protein MN608_01331 [Microdochium nivale]|nr:hypothetical protein MN608_01331 [Microdochium nivale]